MRRAWREVRELVRSKGVRRAELVTLIALIFLAGVAIGGGAIYLLHKRNWLGDAPPPQRAAFSEVAPDKAWELAARYRPWLRFDSKERWRPISVAALLGEHHGSDGDHRFCTAPDDCRPVLGEQAFSANVHAESSFGAGSYLDLDGKALDDYHGDLACAPLADCDKSPGSAIYYHVIRSNDRFYIDYWWFFRYNNFYRDGAPASCVKQEAIDAGICDEHEGDWEGVTVVTKPDDDQTPQYVVYAAHKGTFRYAVSELPPLHDGTRPEVFVARGSHASYPLPCDAADCTQPPQLAVQGLITLPEGRFDGGSPWGRNAEQCQEDAPTSCLLPLPRADQDSRAWTVWPGHWGAGCQEACHGLQGVRSPQSPGLQQRFQMPWCSTQGGALTCDGRALSCGDWLGPLVAVAACDPKVLAQGLGSPKAKDTGSLGVSVRGVDTNHESVPGVVQVLGDPLHEGNTVTVSGGAAETQVLIRAQFGTDLIEARFANLGLGAGRQVTFTLTRDADERHHIVATIPGQPPRTATELRITEVQTVAALVEDAGGGA